MIKLDHLTKRYGDTLAVDDLDFEVKPGVVTGFLGPNGSGKSTTMRIILGLDHATKGRATVNGTRYAELRDPARQVGALLDAKAIHPGRTARNHLRALAASNQIKRSRVDEVLDFVGISAVANKKVGTYSLGMSQRLGIAGALLGDPGVLLFDEPVNGLDPEGIKWIREFFRALANEGRTVFVSSHLMSEMAVSADEIIVIGRGRFITSGSVDDLTKNAEGTVLARASDHDKLSAVVTSHHGVVHDANDDGLTIGALTSDQIGQLAYDAGIVIFELTPQRASLEEVFMDLTADAVEYGSHARVPPMASESTLVASTQAEWIKFRTVRSSIMGVAVTVLLTVGLGVLITTLVRTHWSQFGALRIATFDPVSSSLRGSLFAQFAVGVIGSLFITSEYTTGSIRTTLTAVPDRFRLITSKAVVLFVTTLILGEFVCFAAFLIGQRIYLGVVPTASLQNGTVLRSVVLAGLYLTLLALFAFALGLILRHSAATISVYVSVLLIVPIIGLFFPQSWQNDFMRFEPSSLGISMESPFAPSNSFGAWSATFILLAYVAATLVVALVLFQRRDAGTNQ